MHALAALMLLHGARLDGRVDAIGGMLLLPHQSRERWDRDMIALGFHHLDLACGNDELTSYHLQAGIAAEHAIAKRYGDTNWGRILGYYESLMLIDHSPVARLGHAVAVAQARGPDAGLRLLVPMLPSLPARFPFGQIAQGDWLQELGRIAEAHSYYVLALKNARSEGEAAFISAKLSVCGPLHLVGEGHTS